MGTGNLWVSFVHVRSNLNVVVRPPADPYAYNMGLDQSAPTQFSYINYTSLMKIPRYVMFKADNDMYLYVRPQSEKNGFPHQVFALPSPTDTSVGYETFVTRSGQIRVRSCAFDDFWYYSPLDPLWICVGKPGGSATSDTMFSRRSTRSTTYEIETFNRDVQKEIIIPKDDHDQLEAPPMKYTFTNSVTHGQGSTNFSSQMPYLTEQGQLVIPDEVVSLGLKTWGQTYDYNNNNTIITKSAVPANVTVPAKTRVTASLLATKATCEIPFSYEMSEQFYAGGEDTYNLYDGVFTGQYTYAYQVRIDKSEPL